MVHGSWFKVQGSSHSEAAARPLVACKARKPSAPLVPQILLLQWIGEVQVIEQQNKEMNAFVAELIEKLRKNDADALLVKGQGVAQCGRMPGDRSVASA